MELILLSTAIIIFATAVFGLINEYFLHLTVEISLLVQSCLVAVAFFIVKSLGLFTLDLSVIDELSKFNLNEYLVEGVLCLMLFSGSTGIRYHHIQENSRMILVLSLLTTLLSAVIFGGIVYAVANLTGVKLDLATCMLFGAIISPTDPIAATGILPKLGLPKRTGLIIEAESLFNDGVGVALYVCFKHMVTKSAGENFFVLLGKEIVGGVAIGFVVAFITFTLLRLTKDDYRQISFSLCAVTAAYAISEMVGVSSAIAAVTCGIHYASCIKKYHIKNEHYEAFWDTVDNLLNRVLYIIIGFYAIYVIEMPSKLGKALLVIVANFAARFIAVFAATLIGGELPDDFSKFSFSTLLTWGGLRGGLCLALALSSTLFLPKSICTEIVGCVYIVVFWTTVIQGSTIGNIYKKLRK